LTTGRRSVRILEEEGHLRGELVPVWPQLEVLCHVLVPDKEVLVSPPACHKLTGESQVSNSLLQSPKLLRRVQGKYLVENGTRWDGDQVLSAWPNIRVWET